MNVAKLSDAELQNLMANHRRLKATDRPLYGQAAEEWNRRHGGGLNLERSIAHLRAAAGQGRFVCYGELAEANGMSWDKARYPMDTHLGMLVEHAHHRGWPLLSAMVVNKQHLTTGAMEPETLAGFTKAATELGYNVGEPAAFLRSEQARCFEWGRSLGDAAS